MREEDLAKIPESNAPKLIQSKNNIKKYFRLILSLSTNIAQQTISTLSQSELLAREKEIRDAAEISWRKFIQIKNIMADEPAAKHLEFLKNNMDKFVFHIIYGIYYDMLAKVYRTKIIPPQHSHVYLASVQSKNRVTKKYLVQKYGWI